MIVRSSRTGSASRGPGAISSRLAWLVLCVGCTAHAPPPAARPGTEWVLELGKELEIAYSPLWCREEPWPQRVCTRLSDSEQVVFRWDDRQRPLEVKKFWNRVSPLYAIEVRDSLRQVLERRGGRRITGAPVPNHTSHGVHTSADKWCVEGAVVILLATWQEHQPFEWVVLSVLAWPDPDCSPELFRQHRRGTRVTRRRELGGAA